MTNELEDVVYITGHRNPDMDSVCSAFAYAAYKNHLDPSKTYIPIRCGHMNPATKSVFKQEGLTPPVFMKDLRPTVSEILKRPEHLLHIEDPVHRAMNLLSGKTISVLPVFDGEDSYSGLISVDEITGLFMRENTLGRPQYDFRVDNFSKVVAGRLFKPGELSVFSTYIMTGAMPYEVSLKRIGELPHKPILVVGMRRDLINYAVENQFPAVIITGYHESESIDYDFSSYRGAVFISYLDTAETIRLLRLSLPIKNILTSDAPRLKSSELFDQALAKLLSSGFRGLPVFEEELFVGTVTRRCFITRPKKQVILVDHNELSQSVTGLEDSEVVEIIDHHRLGAEKTRYPIYVAAAPVGSTCTLVYQHYRKDGIVLEPSMARILLAGILSDTVILRSPTTTAVDKKAVEELALIGGIEDATSYGERIFSKTTVITEADPASLIASDFKIYTEYGCRFGIGQVEVITLENVEEIKDTLIEALETQKRQKGLDWALLLITNVIKENSILLSTPFERAEHELVYKTEGPGEFFLPGILSRKKQLLPELLRVLEELKRD